MLMNNQCILYQNKYNLRYFFTVVYLSLKNEYIPRYILLLILLTVKYNNISYWITFLKCEYHLIKLIVSIFKKDINNFFRESIIINLLYSNFLMIS